MLRQDAGAAAGVERFFQFSLLGLVASGYLAVAGSGYLDTPTVVLTTAGLLLRAVLVCGLFRWLRWNPSGRLTTVVTMAYAAFFVADYFLLSRDFLAATVHLLFFLAAIQVVTASNRRGSVAMVVLSFAGLASAAVLSLSFGFLVALVLYLGFAAAALTSAEIRSALRKATATARGGTAGLAVRLVALAAEALRQLGEKEPWRNIIVGREGSVEGWGAKDTILIARHPFGAADLDRARATLSHMQTVYLPGAGIHNHFTDFLTSPDPEKYERDYVFDISPVSDNRPFFFYTVQARDLWKFITTAERNTADYKINKAVPMLFGLMAVSLVATALILILPPLVLRTRLPRQRGVLGFLLFFIFIGAGYILIEVGLIQKFVLFLGHPTYALTVVIFSMLLSSGAGSALSRRIVGTSEGRLVKVLGAVAMLTALLAVVVSSMLTPLVGLPLPLKVAESVPLESITPYVVRPSAKYWRSASRST